MKNKKLVIILVVVVIAIIVYMAWKNSQKRNLQVTQANEQTNANGLFGYLGTIWEQTTGGTSKKMTESEAKEVSKRIADLKETGSESDGLESDSLIQELAAQGWSYIGYNQVKAINP
jgi:predicted negative regulator of RcsB-dependent stress response